MDLQLYKMSFDVAHFGDGLLENSLPTFNAERLFSALFLEALSLNKHEDLLELAHSGDLILSDALFYYFGVYLPKPIGYPKREMTLKSHHSPEERRKKAKLTKKISHLHEYDFDDYILGETEDLNAMIADIDNLYTTVDHTRVYVSEDPYRVGATYYHKDCSLAIIGSKNALLTELLHSLQYSGIGGKRSSGYGRFQLDTEDLSEDFNNRLTVNAEEPVMLLNTSLPLDDELQSILNKAQYLLQKSSGFAYTTQTKDAYRKNDLYKFKAGSTFHQTFTGKLIDVSPDHFPHPVWNYSIPLFYRLGVD